MDITVGGHYKSLRTGEPYTVLGIEPDGIRIQWLDERGWEDLISRNEHLAVLKRLEEKRRDEGRFVRRLRSVKGVMLDYLTLGYLAHHGYFYAKMPASYEDTFVKDYTRFAGEAPDSYNIDPPRDLEWDAVSTSISFGATGEVLDKLDFAEYEATYESHYNRWNVGWNDYFFALISLGFRMGANQDIKRILDRIISHEDKMEFIKGYDHRKKGRLG